MMIKPYREQAHPGADRPARQRHRPVGPADGVQEAVRPPPEPPLRVPGRRAGGGRQSEARRRRGRRGRRRRGRGRGRRRGVRPALRLHVPPRRAPLQDRLVPRLERPPHGRAGSAPHPQPPLDLAAFDVRERRAGPGGRPAAPRAARPAGGGDGPGGPGVRGPGGGEEGEQRVQPADPRDTEQSAPGTGEQIHGGDFASVHS